MDPNTIANTLSLTLFAVSLFVSLRSFYLYMRSRTPRLLILGVSMIVIALTAAAGFAGDNITTISLNVDWFNYIGQTVSFLFILLSLYRSDDGYLRPLSFWHIAVSLLLILLLLTAPILPDFPNPAITKSLLSGSRGVMCFIIFLAYMTSFMTKATRFSLLMTGAFLLISFGYLTIIPKYFQPSDVLDHAGDILRITGTLTLLVAVVVG